MRIKTLRRHNPEIFVFKIIKQTVCFCLLKVRLCKFRDDSQNWSAEVPTLFLDLRFKQPLHCIFCGHVQRKLPFAVYGSNICSVFYQVPFKRREHIQPSSTQMPHSPTNCQRWCVDSKQAPLHTLSATEITPAWHVTERRLSALTWRSGWSRRRKRRAEESSPRCPLCWCRSRSPPGTAPSPRFRQCRPDSRQTGGLLWHVDWGNARPHKRTFKSLYWKVL